MKMGCRGGGGKLSQNDSISSSADLPKPPEGGTTNQGASEDLGPSEGEHSTHELTSIGRTLSRLPIDPRLARMLLEAEREGCLAEVLVIVAGLEINDPRERPAEKTKEADSAHARWRHNESDFLSILGMWMDLGEFRQGRRWRMNRLRKFCRETFLNWRRVLEWCNLRD
jgi:ATP-dependent helicase HrpA